MKGEVRLEIVIHYAVDSENYTIYGENDSERKVETEEEFRQEVENEIYNGDIDELIASSKDLEIKYHRLIIFPEKKEENDI